MISGLLPLFSISLDGKELKNSSFFGFCNWFLVGFRISVFYYICTFSNEYNVLYLFIISRDYVLRMSIDLLKVNGFTLKTTRKKRYPRETITDADYVDDVTLLSNITAQTESKLQSQKQLLYVLNEKEPSPL